MARARGGARLFLTLSAALPVLLAGPAWAARWDVVPTLAVGEIYTDNLSLSPDASKRSDWVTQVVPGIAISAIGGASKFSLSYAPELLYYAQGEGDSTVYHRLNALGNVELAKQLLFVDAGATVGPRSVSLLAPLSLSSFNTTGNVATVATYFVSPFLRRQFGSAVQAEARYSYSVVNSDDAASLLDSVADRIFLRVNSGPAYKLLAWNFDYSKDTTNYDAGLDIDSEVANANARLLITPTVALLARAGYEYYASGIVEAASEGSYWGAGLDWAPTPRTQLAVVAGRRFYGDDYSLDFRHRTRLTAWSAGYSQNVTTARQEFTVPATASTSDSLDQLLLSRIPDPVARQKAVDEFIARTGLPPSLSTPVNFFSSQLFIDKKFQASAGIIGVRHVLIANAFRLTREQLIADVVLSGSGDFVSSNTIIQTGTGLVWTSQVTAQNVWNLRAGYTRNEFPGNGQIDNIAYVVLGLNRRIQRQVSGSLNYRRQQNDSNVAGSDYEENAVFATLQMRF